MITTLNGLQRQKFNPSYFSTIKTVPWQAAYTSSADHQFLKSHPYASFIAPNTRAASNRRPGVGNLLRRPVSAAYNNTITLVVATVQNNEHERH